ncbi:exopolyphosphatase-like protein [Astrocystis sublimbata]|nr:exopolyphosphatase-like protein [Astrocystis sublimbata]
MPPRTSLKTFLATARAALTAPPSKRSTPLTFVVGNESADLDSLCSALLLAYFNTYSPPTASKRASPDGVSSSSSSVHNLNIHIPICHLQRADLALRPEFAAVLRDADVDGAEVFTLEDVLGENGKNKNEESQVSVRPEDTRWLLVDHNVMTGALAKLYGARVIGCVDHHADEGKIPADAEVKVIEKSGSCMSLVVERFMEGWDALDQDHDGGAATAKKSGSEGGSGSGSDDAGNTNKVINAQLARLALAPILIDTTNLQDANKTTEHDTIAVAFAEKKVAVPDTQPGEGGGGGDAYDRDAFFKRIMDLKEDIADMSFRDVLRKDYKEWAVANQSQSGIPLRLGTSSVPRGFGYLVDVKANGNPSIFIDALQAWGGEKDSDEEPGNMDLVAVLTGFQDETGTFRRELLVWARSDEGKKAAALFVERRGEELGLRTWGDGGLDLDLGGDEDRGWRRAWAQGAVQYSRKQIAPMLREALEEVAKGGG